MYPHAFMPSRARAPCKVTANQIKRVAACSSNPEGKSLGKSELMQHQKPKPEALFRLIRQMEVKKGEAAKRSGQNVVPVARLSQGTNTFAELSRYVITRCGRF